ncbi:hypothetical protein BTZ20_0150 [Rhodococcus sp. MTM3W5.2]|nr:hypothetical protein BTZ20_0150 [Rhodococcus sp. MTM3W5.2]
MRWLIDGGGRHGRAHVGDNVADSVMTINTPAGGFVVGTRVYIDGSVSPRCRISRGSG